MRAWNRLTANFVRGDRKRGRYSDGNGLYLQVSGIGTKSWVVLYRRGGKSRARGLGSGREWPLAVARGCGGTARESRAGRFDPIEERKANVQADRAERAKRQTFRDCTMEHYGANGTRWDNEKHKKDWIASLTTHAFPVLGGL